MLLGIRVSTKVGSSLEYPTLAVLLRAGLLPLRNGVPFKNFLPRKQCSMVVLLS